MKKLEDNGEDKKDTDKYQGFGKQRHKKVVVLVFL